MSNKTKTKTKKALKKRIKKSSTGKWNRKSARTSHLFANKTTKSKRQAKKGKKVSSSDIKRLKNLV